ncbi:MAG: Ig-like domain-containing protein, partial [Mobilicoccus sp.]|nr:Ig-like domain-containing protein [Mobilicoccus sp.]
MSALTRPVRLACAVALVAWSGAGAPLSADAVGVPDAVTDVRIEEERAYTWSQVRLHLNWQVPDGTQAGDTFSLTLPPQLAATDGMTFPLNDAAGQAVANARVAGNVVTFTMTNYAENHTGVRGTAWFWVNFTEVVQPGEDLELAFEVESTTFRDTIRIGNPVPAPEDGAFKWQRWEHEAGQRLDRFLWAIDGPVVRENMINAPYEIVDVAGPGQAIDCDDVHIFAGGPQDWSNPAYITRNRLEEFACSTEQVSFTYFPTQAELGRSIRLLGHSDVTDTTLPAYRNSGVVRIWETAEWEVSHVLNAGGGGDGEGQEPTTPPTTEPGEPPTDEPTTPAPTDEPTTPA